MRDRQIPGTVHLVRHAEPADDLALSDHGRVQASLLRQRLHGLGVDAVHHGPAPRTAQTARLLADGLPGVTARETPLLRDLTPVPAPAEEDSCPARLREWLAGVPQDEQDPGGLLLTSAVQHFSEASASTCSVLVTHAFVIGWFVRTALDAPSHRWMELFPDHASLTTIAYRDDGREPALVRFNDTGHLP